MFQWALRNVEGAHRFTSHNLHCRHLSHSCFHFLSLAKPPPPYPPFFFCNGVESGWQEIWPCYSNPSVPFNLADWKRGGRLTDHSSPAFFLCGNHYKPVYSSDLRPASQPYAVYMHSRSQAMPHAHHSCLCIILIILSHYEFCYSACPCRTSVVFCYQSTQGYIWIAKLDEWGHCLGCVYGVYSLCIWKENKGNSVLLYFCLTYPSLKWSIFPWNWF